MKLFITGATGFIGSNLINHLNNKKNEICINVNRNRTFDIPENIETFEFSVDDPQLNLEFFKKKKFNGVIHLATCFIKDHKFQDVSEIINSNLLFSSLVLECAARSDVEWFLNTGTVTQNINNMKYSCLLVIYNFTIPKLILVLKENKPSITPYIYIYI